MANYEHMLACPNCGMRVLNLLNYQSLMVIRSNLGLFTLICPNCSGKVSSLQNIPPELEGEVELAALEVGAEMGGEIE